MRYVLSVWLLLALALPAAAEQCHGKFPNYVTDVCWSCMFPMRAAGVTVMGGDQEDTPNPGQSVCFCSTKAGVPVSFWEAARQVDVTRTPWCMVGLGGVKLDPGVKAPHPAQGRSLPANPAAANKQAFYHAHWYINPLMYVLGVMFDNNCLENTGFDVAYLTELDPTWSDDELTLILNPDAVLFGNPIAQAACAADAVSASAGFPLTELFWCAGSQGTLYPLNGHVGDYGFGVRASELIMQRMTAKMHREGLMWGTWGEQALCGYYPQILMNKRAYKQTMLYPVPGTSKINGRCCQPYGRSTALWGAGKNFPTKGEDYSYLIFRKRNCCQSVVGK